MHCSGRAARLRTIEGWAQCSPPRAPGHAQTLSCSTRAAARTHGAVCSDAQLVASALRWPLLPIARLTSSSLQPWLLHGWPSDQPPQLRKSLVAASSSIVALTLRLQWLRPAARDSCPQRARQVYNMCLSLCRSLQRRTLARMHAGSWPGQSSAAHASTGQRCAALHSHYCLRRLLNRRHGATEQHHHSSLRTCGRAGVRWHAPQKHAQNVAVVRMQPQNCALQHPARSVAAATVADTQTPFVAPDNAMNALAMVLQPAVEGR